MNSFRFLFGNHMRSVCPASAPLTPLHCSDPISQYVSLLSLSNVSVLVLMDRFYGFYIHGRSVHNRADCNDLEIANQIKQEENGLAPKRGLNASSEQQVSGVGEVACAACVV